MNILIKIPTLLNELVWRERERERKISLLFDMSWIWYIESLITVDWQLHVHSYVRVHDIFFQYRYYGARVINSWPVMYSDPGTHRVFGNIILYIALNRSSVLCKLFCNDYKSIPEFIKPPAKSLMLITGIKWIIYFVGINISIDKNLYAVLFSFSTESPR